MSHTNSASGSPPGDPELSDHDIALLCDIGASFPATLSAEKLRRLERLIAEGFVEPAGAAKTREKYQLTAKAQKVLGERGVGPNEA
jgi:hypothetical protein